ncbi:4Fe-4S dicluster domain-containing protein [Paenibacillus sp. HW567]|uniref:4Fe-4S dicluster domain-containing protein n=1 Tax=Paenibacillus sp. HW567 TaxID=1034769 RepID=UPI000366CA9B|nr:ferredoxin family protein [Paenibacillus sp. HW567]
MKYNAKFIRNPATLNAPIVIDPELCIKCNRCTVVCRTNVLMPDLTRQVEPTVFYPEECWLCGSCVEHCPASGAIEMKHPLTMRIGWRRKDSGEFYRIGGKKPSDL